MYTIIHINGFRRYNVLFELEVGDKLSLRERVFKSIRESRADIIRAIMEPWIPGDVIDFSELLESA